MSSTVKLALTVKNGDVRVTLKILICKNRLKERTRGLHNLCLEIHKVHSTRTVPWSSNISLTKMGGGVKLSKVP
jgi:hypothetical protein